MHINITMNHFRDKKLDNSHQVSQYGSQRGYLLEYIGQKKTDKFIIFSIKQQVCMVDSYPCNPMINNYDTLLLVTKNVAFFHHKKKSRYQKRHHQE